MELTLFNVLLTTTNLFLLWLLFFVLFRDYRVDAFRQRLFKLRMDLFDYAASGAVSFDDPAYGILRSRINNLIRYAHRFSAIQFFVVATMGPDVPEAELPVRRWEHALDAVHDESVRKELRKFNYRLFENLLRHLVTGSVLFAIFFVATSIWFIGARFCSAIYNFITVTGNESSQILAPQMEGLSSLEGQAAEVIEEAAEERLAIAV